MKKHPPRQQRDRKGKFTNHAAAAHSTKQIIRNAATVPRPAPPVAPPTGKPLP
jgi:hypothetical protein